MIQNQLPLIDQHSPGWEFEARTMNLTFALEGITEPTAKAIAAQEKSLGSSAKVVLDEKMALGHHLAEQGGVCALVPSTRCTWMNASGEVEIQLWKIPEQTLGFKR